MALPAINIVKVTILAKANTIIKEKYSSAERHKKINQTITESYYRTVSFAHEIL